MISDKFEYTLGTPNSGFSMFLAERTKKAQAKKLKTHLSQRPSQGRPFTTFDLVVVSPLTRTLETARHIFGRGRSPGKPAFLDEGSEMNIDEGIYGHIAAPRMLVREECRERFGHYVCDGRRPIRELYDEFGDFDFSEVQYDEDSFYTDERESDQACCDRALAFLEWLNKRPEKCIAVVTHSSFLRHLFGQFGGNLERGDADNLRKLAGNCELRSVVMCSHGSKERGTIKPMIAPPSASPSDYHT